MIAFVINLALAVVWFLLGEPPTPERFFVGLVLGFLVVLVGERVLPESGYTRRMFAFVRFLIWFTKALVLANHAMAMAILTRRRRDMRPVIADYPVEGLRREEILLLSHCITLTPGTLTVDVARDLGRLRLHVFDGRNVEAVIEEIRTGLEKPILAFNEMIDIACTIGIAVLSGCVVLGLVLLARGPTVLDRLLALDAVLYFGVGILSAFSILERTAVYLELILVIALLGFFTMVAFFYYLHRLPRGAPEFDADANGTRKGAS